jgi:hypothetical protein
MDQLLKHALQWTVAIAISLLVYLVWVANVWYCPGGCF